jgi:hypothetical protein
VRESKIGLHKDLSSARGGQKEIQNNRKKPLLSFISFKEL